MDQFEILKKRARENQFAAQYLDSLSRKSGMEIFKMRLKKA